MSGSWEINISDHQPIYVVRKKNRTTLPRTSFECRNFKNYTKEEFQLDLVNFDWTDFFQISNPDEAWDYLYRVILECADKHCPVKFFTSKKEKPEWLNQEILEYVKERDKVYSRLKDQEVFTLGTKLKYYVISAIV